MVIAARPRSSHGVWELLLQRILVTIWAFVIFGVPESVQSAFVDLYLVVTTATALISGLPVIAAVVSAVRSRGARVQRALTAVMAAAHLVPLASWQFSTSGAPSLTTYLSPTATVVVVAIGVVVAGALTVLRFRSGATAGRAAT
ncbi:MULTISPECIES: hypothetical protein [Pseudonocardia]|uniref:Uncharacterized protein n=2 Tax=Pseudonocardia TaxID=1847 RepID=A0A1Y2MU84_PSEAH|nr:MULTISPECIES: hypothetical protein [Pseudonocardia]OSY38138.1 hypothetical protein BG845_04311 [Pseudonocardia autotrophica]TDN75579.1 hypothetical protein C8E95_4756 [Pseudonocardia autotrophica]BBF99549.1 hypothetical protein Pdca_07590 [Pseudonocardia autotrophica]GEC27788.1 hypothetical protein PSA01_48170 [Pseudonocardia saturnea]